MLRQLVPEVYLQLPEHVQAHAVEILSLAPEFRELFSVPYETLTSLAVPTERTRFYSRTRTLQLAHGIIDFLKGCLDQKMYRHLTLYFDNVHQADPLDQELLGVLLRRADPATLTVVLGTTVEPLAGTLQTALLEYTHQVDAQPPEAHTYLQLLRRWQFPEVWQTWLLKQSDGWAEEYEPLRDNLSLLQSHAPQGETFEQGMQTLCEQASAEHLQRDPLLIAAWTNRAILLFEEEKIAEAIQDLSHALELEENPTVLYNRGIAYQTLGRWQEAINDFTQALTLSDEEEQDILSRRHLCVTQLENTDSLRQDLREHLTSL